MDLPLRYLERMRRLVGDGYDDYLAALELPKRRGLLLNTVKADVAALSDILPLCRPLPFSANGYEFTGAVKAGKLPLHHAGAFYMQEPSAMLPAEALEIDPDWNVLDLCASPGGKTADLALKLKKGRLVANEINAARAATLLANVERLGFTNVTVLNERPERLAAAYGPSFDLVVVDAPCSGEGMFRKSEAATLWTPQTPSGCAARQTRLLSYAAELVRPGGRMLYSTCTFSTEENEEVVRTILDKKEFSLVPPLPGVVEVTEAGVEVGGGYDYTLVRRAYPHRFNGEGQFFAVFRKIGEKTGRDRADKREERTRSAAVETLLEAMGLRLPYFIEGNRAYLKPNGGLEVPRGLRTMSRGVAVADLVKGRAEPCHNLFTACGAYIANKRELSESEALGYLRGEELESCGAADGYGVATYKGISLGGFKAKDGRLKNKYPKGLRDR